MPCTGAASLLVRGKISRKSCHPHITSAIINSGSFVLFEVDSVVHTTAMALFINTVSFRKSDYQQ